jgi:hypothetical protein
MENYSPTRLVFPAVLLIGSMLFSVSFFTGSAFSQKSIKENLSYITNQEQRTLSDKFPASIQYWQSTIENAAKEYQLDPNLIAAVMLQESGGNDEVISSSGAVGLMQVMPKDGIAVDFICDGHPCFTNRPTTEELLEPDFNIRYGSRLLAALIRKKGSVREALFHYGPMDVGYDYADIVLEILDGYS